ncbi:arylsulfatase [Algoriphagus sp. H41]|uniref:Arylsulfatase n=2 Tax=Algoriphagus oliviformis TaxID=2811231 RepID=A0ABS3CAP2_9BACT|nr:arylsulfatase [Algoriphagus oliviformis]
MLAQAQSKPNILVIWGDDIGWSNVGFNNNGLMGYKTPNIDRIAKEGAVFTDWYGQQSCTAGRAAFILGQHPFRTGLLTIGMPGDSHGIQKTQPTIADLLKPQGYATGQFGKNHLGDQDEHLPTNHGFDEFFGNLYHLNAEEEPEGYYYPKDPEFRKKFGPRGVIHSTADGNIQDTGPLTSKRMETVDDEFENAAIAFIEKAHADGKPFFVWLSATRMHVWTHLKPESDGVTGIGLYADGMVEHDKAVGRILDKLDELGITDNTIVMYSTDNGAEKFSWPDGGSSPFRGEKGTTWEGGFRVPTAIRWPGVIKPGTVHNEIFSHEDMMPTLVAAAGEPNIKEKVLKGYQANGKTFKQHLDGYNMMPFLKGDVKESPRKEIFYFDAGGNLNAIRYEMWKLHFAIMDGAINTAYRKSPSWPLAINLRADPYEVSWESGMYTRWYGENMWLFVPAQRFAAQFLSTFKDFPPQTGSSLSVDKVVQQLASPARN